MKTYFGTLTPECNTSQNQDLYERQGESARIRGVALSLFSTGGAGCQVTNERRGAWPGGSRNLRKDGLSGQGQ